MSFSLRICVVCSLLAVGGCQRPVPTETAPAAGPTQEPRERALAAKQELFQQLSTRLMDAVSDGGPAGAISVCKEEAPRIAAEVGEQHGLKIGRTSFRLRNPGNLPPEWALEMIEQRVDEPQFLDLDDGRTAALLPIRLQPLCLMCHGDPEQLGDDLKTALAEQYPEDQATGFKDGDLRGWFWVEVP